MSPDEQYRASTGELSRLVYRHDADLYYGNGKPGLTTRMETVENAVKRLIEEQESRKKKQDRIELLVWGALIVAIVNLVATRLNH